MVNVRAPQVTEPRWVLTQQEEMEPEVTHLMGEKIDHGATRPALIKMICCSF